MLNPSQIKVVESTGLRVEFRGTVKIKSVKDLQVTFHDPVNCISQMALTLSHSYHNSLHHRFRTTITRHQVKIDYLELVFNGIICIGMALIEPFVCFSSLKTL